MRHDLTGLEFGVLVNNRRIAEFDVKLPLTGRDGVDLIQCCIPVIPEAHFKVVVQGPPLQEHTDLNAVLTVDGDFAMSKCQSKNSRRVKFVLDSVRVSATQVRPLRFSKAKYSGSAWRTISPDSGVIKVDIWRGCKEGISYDPVLRFADEITNTQIRQEICSGEIGANDVGCTFLPTDSKGAVSNNYVVDFGPCEYRNDSRRKFLKSQKVLTCLYYYKDKDSIVAMNLERAPPSSFSTRLAKLARLHSVSKPITIVDDDTDPDSN